MEIEEIIEFLETRTLSVTFSPDGLKYLSLKGNKGESIIDLKEIYKGARKDSREYILLQETGKFLETGNHNMILDFTDFTRFQQEVFEAVSKTKPGEVYTYKDIAIMIGRPGGAQAVGSAVSKSSFSYLLPTHRVFSKRGFPRCKNKAGYLREKLLILEGHDVSKLRGNYTCTRKNCCIE